MQRNHSLIRWTVALTIIALGWGNRFSAEKPVVFGEDANGRAPHRVYRQRRRQDCPSNA